MKKYFKVLRVENYIKNLLIIVPYFFSGKIVYFPNIEYIKIILAFLAFSLVSSSVYIINDIKDINNDKIHKEKQNRVIASGQISILCASIIAIMLAIIGLAISYYVSMARNNYSNCIY